MVLGHKLDLGLTVRGDVWVDLKERSPGWLFEEALHGKVKPGVISALQQKPACGEFHRATSKFSGALTYKREPQID